jgi:hypothetical protein
MSAQTSPRRSFIRRFAPWMPATALLAAGLATTLGLSMPTASALVATDSDNVTITASVPLEIHNAYSATNCRGSGGTDGTLDGTSLTTALDDTSLGTCRVIFGTNNAASGAILSVASANTNGNFFCIRSTPGTPTSACIAGANNKFTDGSGADMGEGTVGGSLSNATNCTATNWTVAGTKANITNAGTNVCTQNTVGTNGDYTVQFFADPSTSQGPGAYEGRAVLTATAS